MLKMLKNKDVRKGENLESQSKKCRYCGHLIQCYDAKFCCICTAPVK